MKRMKSMRDLILEKISDSIVDLNRNLTIEAVEEALEKGLEPLEIIERGLSAGMRRIGDKFQRLEVFLPELILGAKIFADAMKLIEPVISKKGIERETEGKVVMGTVKGDIHNIGKDIVVMLLKTGGFEVHDLGVDVEVSKFIEKAREMKADMIGLSSLLTSTMPIQKDLIDVLKEKGERDKYLVIVGGGPVTQRWAEEIGADGYAVTAEEAVRLARDLMQRRK
jgi:corrinoid protein of di/trimethylamine methyltransferase